MGSSDKTIIYISGQMTGIKNYNFEKFNKTEKYLSIFYDKVINPAKISLQMAKRLNKKLFEIKREEYLKQDIKELIKCTHIYMLKGWKKSKGAKLEHYVAHSIGLTIIFES